LRLNNIDTIKRNRNSDTSKEVGLDVNAEKTKYMLLPRYQNAGQNHNIMVGDGSFENVAQFKYEGSSESFALLYVGRKWKEREGWGFGGIVGCHVTSRQAC
jgi:hypothetical protein